METAFGSEVFVLGATLEQLAEAADAKPDEELAFEALKLHLSDVQENGLVSEAFRMAELVGAACLGHLHNDSQRNDELAVRDTSERQLVRDNAEQKEKAKKKSKKKTPDALPTPPGKRPGKGPKKQRGQKGKPSKKPVLSGRKSRVQAA